MRVVVATISAAFLTLAWTMTPVAAQDVDYGLTEVVDDSAWCESIMLYTQWRYSTDFCGDCDESMNIEDARFQTEKLLPYCMEFLKSEQYAALTGEAEATVPITLSMLIAAEDYDWRADFPCAAETGSFFCDDE